MENKNIVLKMLICLAVISGNLVQGVTWEVWSEFSVLSPPNCFYLETLDGDDITIDVFFEP